MQLVDFAKTASVDQEESTVERSRAAICWPYCHVAIAPPCLATPKIRTYFMHVSIVRWILACLYGFAQRNLKHVVASYPGPLSLWGMRLSAFTRCMYVYAYMDEIMCFASVWFLELCDKAEGFAFQCLIVYTLIHGVWSLKLIKHGYALSRCVQTSTCTKIASLCWRKMDGKYRSIKN